MRKEKQETLIPSNSRISPHTHYDPLTFLDPCPNWFTDWRGIRVAMGGQGAIKSMGSNNFQNCFKPSDDTVYGSFLIALV
jgi:hypothetical protein